MADLFGALLLLVGGVGSLAAYLAILVYLLPGFTGRAQRALETMPGRSLVVGLVNWLFFAVIAFLLAAIGNELPRPLRGLFNLTAFAIILALLAATSIGLAALVTLLRDRFTPLAASPKNTIWTAVLLLIAGLAPIVGWFILTPAALAASLGATIITLILRPRPQKPIQTPEI
jgi:hypothetical protein